MTGSITSWMTLALAGAGIAAAVVAVVRAKSQTSEPGAVPRGWRQTMGTVLSSTVQVGRAGTGRRETPIVLYAYQVGGTVFQGSRVRAGRDGNASHTVARYPAGASVVVYYDPADPSNSALER